MATTLSDEIEMLRVQLETSLTMPVFLVVSSARADDGKALVAAELAQSMHAAGYSTLLVLADEHTRNIHGAHEPMSLADVQERGIAPYLVRNSTSGLRMMVMPSNKIRQTVSREAMTSFVDTCRKTYQVTIVEAAVVLMNPFAMLAATAADGVLLTVREGRRVRSEDRQLAKSLERERAPFLGVVTVSEAVLSSVTPDRVQKRVAWGKTPSVSADIGPSREQQIV